MPQFPISLATDRADIARCMGVRRAVFIVEQAIAEADDIDGLDDASWHVLASSGGAPVGAARLRVVDGFVKVQRVCVLESHRGQGIATALVRFAIDMTSAQNLAPALKLSAQTGAIKLYEKLGFQPVDAPYLDVGILHQDMMLVLAKG